MGYPTLFVRHRIPLLFAGPLRVTLITPADASTVTNAAMPVLWTFAPGAQQSFRVRVWAEAAQTTVLYDSGIVAQGGMNHTIPAGSLAPTGTVYIAVDIVTTDGDQGTSDLHTITLSFATSVDVTGVTVTPIGGCLPSGNEDARVLPALQIAWTQIVPGGGETFAQYDVWRRRGDRTTAWTLIGEVAAVATVSFIDACATSRVAYDYAVTWRATDATGNTLVSARQTPPIIGRAVFDRSYVHDVADRDEFATLYTIRVEEIEAQAVAFIQPWGRAAPTAQVGEEQAARIAVRGQRGGHVFQRREWERLTDLVARQRDEAAVFCLRLGRGGRRYFVSWDREQSITTARATASPSLALREVHYDEDLN